MDSKLNAVSKNVSQIIARVRKQGDRALEFYIRKFDGVRVPAGQFAVKRKEMKQAFFRLSPSVRAALLEAKKRIEFFHRQELKRTLKSWGLESEGIRIGQMAVPLDSIGAYVPGGRTCYPSTVLMTCVPAKVAGVRNVVIVSPPKNLKDEILGAAYVAGADRCYGVGGPAAIAALAYGTRTIPKVQKIVGPGNSYVTEAKRQVFGQVGIDGLAGPSEIAVWADASASPRKVALNLIAQAEHDPQTKGFLFSSDSKLLKKVAGEIPERFRRQIQMTLSKSEQDIARKINAIAPEHLILAVKKPKRVLSLIRHAGAIFLGENSPAPLGDYVAGPSHVLPTGGSAQFNSGLSVKDFLRWSSVIENRSGKSKKAFTAARTLAQLEGLYYHALCLAV